MFSNKLFLFSYEILNAPSKRENQVFVEFLPSFFQCCFMNETQVLMTVSSFVWFFLGIISWKGALLFNDGVCGEWGYYWFWLRRFSKKSWHEGTLPPPTISSPIMGNPECSALWLMNPSYVRNTHWVLARAMTCLHYFSQII